MQLSPEDAARDPTEGDTGKVYSTVDTAALDTCAWLWVNVPGAKEQEYCGAIYRDAKGIKAGLPRTKGKSGHCTIPAEPPGTDMVGAYHNHVLTNDFSAVDLSTIWEIAHYLCTPTGHVLKFTVRNGKETLK